MRARGGPTRAQGGGSGRVRMGGAGLGGAGRGGGRACLGQELLDETKELTSKTRWKEARDMIKDDPRSHTPPPWRGDVRGREAVIGRHAGATAAWEAGVYCLVCLDSACSGGLGGGGG